MQGALIKQNNLLKQNLIQEEAASSKKDATIQQLKDLVIQLEALNVLNAERIAEGEEQFLSDRHGVHV
jgi:hypothetical protein